MGEILGDAPDLARWWPSVYLQVDQLAAGDARGLGKVVDLYTKGWLPYTLRWQFQVTELYDDGFRLDATGDFVGRGIWTLTREARSACAGAPRLEDSGREAAAAGFLVHSELYLFG